MIINKKFLDNLASFLFRAKKETYANGELAKKIKEADGSTSLIYEEIDWKYHNNYFGEEPFSGREVAFYKNEPIFFMCYYRKFFRQVDDLKQFYTFLRKALSKVSEEKPFRGPTFFYGDKFEESFEVDDTSKEISYSYFSNTNGDIKDFDGFEFISHDNEKLYETSFMGGLINLHS